MNTRSRSASSASGSSSSSSSSSGSSSSSSGSDSDSSSSGTGASRASSQESRASRSSARLKANEPTKKPPSVQSKPVKKLSTSSSTKGVKNKRSTGNSSSDSESESTSVTSSPAKKAPIKSSDPKSKAVTSTSSSKNKAASSSNKVPIKPSKLDHVSSSSGPKKDSKISSTSKVLPTKTKPKVTGTNSKQKTPTKVSSLSKSIFSPENSSGASEGEGSASDKRKAELKKKSAVAATTKQVQTVAQKKKVTKASLKQEIVPKSPKVFSSSSQSESSTIASSSASSSAAENSDNEKLPEKKELVTKNSNLLNKIKKQGSSVKKRPLTRTQRRNVKTKTIPTTTNFNQKCPYVQTANSSNSDFSDEPSNSLIRVPAKQSNQKGKKVPTAVLLVEEEPEERKCPFPGCDSMGHLSGKFPTHTLLTTCPKYHELSADECKENAVQREKRDNERKKYYVPNQVHIKKPSKPSPDAKNWIATIKELKNKNTNDGFCTEYDMSLWNDALATSAARVEGEQSEGISRFSVCIGRYEMSCWCRSPYPEPLCHNRRLFICEFCLKPVQSGTVLRRHCSKCVWKYPPGDEIYRKERLSVWEVDGKRQKTYCQYLCLLAKCFLDHKTLYLDVDPFLFYVMTIIDSSGCHLVGYFSKEKNSFLNYNVSCILTLPPFQRQGFGRLLIDFSYLLTRVEGKVGSPEKPLSDLGLISYRSYWKDAVLRRMCASASGEIQVKNLSIELGISNADLISTLQFLGMLKYWKGKHLILKKQDVLEEYLERMRKRGDQMKQIDHAYLRWQPWPSDVV